MALINTEVQRRYPNTVEMNYVNLDQNDELLPHDIRESISNQGLFWPVATINDTIFRDGTLTLPSVVQAIERELQRTVDRPE